jgi:hypothetical protein
MKKILFLSLFYPGVSQLKTAYSGMGTLWRTEELAKRYQCIPKNAIQVDPVKILDKMQCWKTQHNR